MQQTTIINLLYLFLMRFTCRGVGEGGGCSSKEMKESLISWNVQEATIIYHLINNHPKIKEEESSILL